MSSATLVSNGTTPKLTQDLLITVHDFFRNVNWDDSPPDVQNVKRNAAPGASIELSLLLPVHQFFAAVNWDGAEIGTVSTPAPAAPPSVANDFTLDDFSDLF